MYGPLSHLWKVAIWTLLILVAASATVTVVPAYIPPVWKETRTSRLDEPRSGAYRRIEVETVGTGYRTPTAPQKVSFRLIPHVSSDRPAKPITLLVSLPDFTCRCAGCDETVPNELATQKIMDWMAAGGINTRDPKVRQEADELLQLARQTRAGKNLEIKLRSFSEGGTGMSASARPPAWAIPGLAAVWLFIWAAGLWYIRRTRQPGAAQMTLSS
jgi:hypothetical protein